jgi:hypothetical protein
MQHVSTPGTANELPVPLMPGVDGVHPAGQGTSIHCCSAPRRPTLPAISHLQIWYITRQPTTTTSNINATADLPRTSSRWTGVAFCGPHQELLKQVVCKGQHTRTNIYRARLQQGATALVTDNAASLQEHTGVPNKAPPSSIKSYR